ncbi:glycosyltransferase family 25 protein [Marinobacter salicampi]|uniref:glycosyltransferase family 25 protein n=1 Tax=Marinobacter salicampi TaxID=435907 RepID=UPI00140E89D1|nr:glycosyltransferase family 25 protein [Marinobacter salicampi]
MGAIPPIYCVSLESDKSRRLQLSEKFPIHFNMMKLVEAVDGRKLDPQRYFQYIFPAVSSGYRMLSPAEIGCTLSHIKAINKFLESKRASALIIEDDVIGTDSDLGSVLNDVAMMPENSVIIFGGQEGMPSSKYIFGKPAGMNGILRLPTYSNSYVLRTCCYGVTRTSAKAMLDAHSDYLKLADAWNLFFRDTDINILFTKKLSHPYDRSSSHIEKSRLLLKGTSKPSLMARFKKRGVRIRRRLGALVCFLAGYRRVK